MRVRVCDRERENDEQRKDETDREKWTGRERVRKRKGMRGSKRDREKRDKQTLIQHLLLFPRVLHARCSPEQIIEGEPGNIVFADILKFSNKPLMPVIRRTSKKEEITNNPNLIHSQIYLFLGLVFFSQEC